MTAMEEMGTGAQMAIVKGGMQILRKMLKKKQA
jgi:hypothetical protein